MSPRAHAPHDGPRASLFGAAGDTGNLGVSALQEATTEALLTRIPDLRLTVYDHTGGARRAAVETADVTHTIELRGARQTRRVYRPDSWAYIRSSLRTKALPSASARSLAASDAVLDFSGGDSFSDLYGAHRFATTSAPKQVAVAHGIPLVLMPQTYGPFTSPAALQEARRLVGAAHVAWARDPDSHVELRELLGPWFDPRRHREGVDVAFGLRPRAPDPSRLGALVTWLRADRERPVAGINLSGLLWEDGEAYGLRLDYARLIGELIDRLLRRTDARVLLVAHVPGTRGDGADVRANAEALAARAAHRGRLASAPVGLSARETKWVIGRTDWFCGTRMHACIAALSSDVPASAIAYSRKTRGVFATAGQEERVVDARRTTTDDALEALWLSWEHRAALRAELRRALPATRARLTQQMDAIAADLLHLARRQEEATRQRRARTVSHPTGTAPPSQRSDRRGGGATAGHHV